MAVSSAIVASCFYLCSCWEEITEQVQIPINNVFILDAKCEEGSTIDITLAYVELLYRCSKDAPPAFFVDIAKHKPKVRACDAIIDRRDLLRRNASDTVAKQETIRRRERDGQTIRRISTGQ